MARVARRAQPARRGDGRGAGGAAARRRATSRSTTPSARSTSGCTSTKRRPAPTPTTSTCCRTRITARRPTGRAPRSGSCARSASACRSRWIRAPTTDSTPIDFRLVNDKVVVRAKVNDGSFQDFVVDTGAENTVITRPTAQRLGITPITYTLSAGVGDVGLRGLQLARIDSLELGHAQAAQRPVPDQGSAAARPAGEGNREPVAAGARLLDDHRLQDAARSRSASSCRRSRPTSSCRCGCTAWRRCAARSTARTGELRRRHRRRGDLDQPGDAPTALGPAGAGAADRAEGVRHRRAGTRTRS